jgi:general secretion pathway protein E
VFSTLHTNDAISAFTRLIDMGLEPFLVASALRGVLAQRLVRQLCPECAVPADAPIGEIADEFAACAPAQLHRAPQWKHAVGCRHCHGTGYRGRIAVYETIPVTAALRDAILQRLPAHDAAEIARRSGFRSLRQDGLIKAASGITSLDEVIRVTGLDTPE